MKNNQPQTNDKQPQYKWKILGVFTFALIIICAFVFLLNYNIAFDDSTDGGWLPPSFSVIVFYFFLAVLAIIASVILKIFLKNHISILALLLASVSIPIICYNVNHYTLKKDGPLYFLMDEGGIFHFIEIEDYNFDGITDKYYEIETQKRTVEHTCDKIFHPDILSVSSKTTGIGYMDSNYVLIQNEDLYDFYYCYTRSPKTTYDNVFIDVAFQNADLANSTTICMVNIETSERTKLDTEQLNETTLRIKLQKEQLNSFDDDVYNVHNYFYFALT